MKSTTLSMTLTIFVLTAVLVALDLSGASRVDTAASGVAQVTASRSALTAGAQADRADAEDEDDDDEADGETLNAFLVSPWPAAPTKDGTTPVLRYD